MKTDQKLRIKGNNSTLVVKLRNGEKKKNINKRKKKGKEKGKLSARGVYTEAVMVDTKQHLQLGLVILSCAAAVALAQHRPLKEAGHFHAITEPHLPRDPNVLLATQNFLNQFAELKALADAAPDPPPRPTSFAPVQRHFPVQPPTSLSGAHRFAPQPAAAPIPVAAPVAPPSPAPAPPPVHLPRQFDVHGQIRTLLNQHRPKVVPTFAPAPPALSPTPAVAQPVPTFAPARPPPAVRFPNFSVLSSVGGHQRVTSTAPRISGTGFTPDVLAAQKNLAAAHQNILRQQAALAPTLF